ncbi:MAG: hypothetical protein U0354_18660 [Candidatus Sericytochromatia bacterium]
MVDTKKSFFGPEFDEENERLRKSSINTNPILNYEKLILKQISSFILFISVIVILIIMINLYLFNGFSTNEKEVLTGVFVTVIFFIIFLSLSKQIGNAILYEEIKSKYRIAYNLLKKSASEDEMEELLPFDKSSLKKDDEEKEDDEEDDYDSNQEFFCKIENNKDNKQTFKDKIIIKFAVIFTIIYFFNMLISLSKEVIIMSITNILFLFMLSIFSYYIYHLNKIHSSIKDRCYVIISEKKHFIVNLQRLLEVKTHDKEYYRSIIKRSITIITFEILASFISANILGFIGGKAIADDRDFGFSYAYGTQISYLGQIISVFVILSCEVFFSLFVYSTLEKNYYLSLMEKGYSIDDYKLGRGIYIPNIIPKNYTFIVISLAFFIFDIVVNLAYQMNILGSEFSFFLLITCMVPCLASYGFGFFLASKIFKVKCNRLFVKHTNL